MGRTGGEQHWPHGGLGPWTKMFGVSAAGIEGPRSVAGHGSCPLDPLSPECAQSEVVRLELSF